MAYKWREGSHAPKGVSAALAAKAIEALGEEISAEALLEQSKKPRHILHGELWSEGDAAWAQKARLQRCREIISAVVEEIEIGGKTFETRSFEFVKGSYRTIESISASSDLISDFIEQIAADMESFRLKLLRINQIRAN